MNNKYARSLRGFKDILPEDLRYYYLIENTLKNITNSYSINELRTPLLESTSVFDKSLGSQTDIVTKEMYTFSDKNGDSVCLRPEGTSSIVRSVIENNLIYDRGIKKRKYWYYGPMFRYERPQKGRLRQFNQFGLEYFGFSGISSDIELIILINKLFKALKINDYKLHINSIGNQTDRDRYGAEVKSIISDNISLLTDGEKATLENNPLRLLDSKNMQIKDILSSLPALYEYINDNSHKRFDAVTKLLDKLKIDYTLDNAIVRGLDYYNDTVMEWKTDKLGSQDAICAGGRYDQLIQSNYSIDIPAVGVAVGVERLVELLKTNQYSSNETTYAIVNDCNENMNLFIEMSESIRSAYPSHSFMNTDSESSMSSQIKYAKKLNDKLAIIINNNQIKLFNFKDNNQIVINISDLKKYLS